jgi:CRP-like cAMP-binding protein
LADRLGYYLALSNSELEFLRALHEPKRHFGRHHDIVVAGKRCDHLFIFCDGLVSRYKVLPDGRRHVLNLVLPGDLIGFPSSLFKVAVNSVGLFRFTRFPHVGAALFWSSGCEVAMCGEHLVNLGRRSAYERLAHLILELLVRLRAIGVAGELSYTLPLTQELMADVLGLNGHPR